MVFLRNRLKDPTQKRWQLPAELVLTYLVGATSNTPVDREKDELPRSTIMLPQIETLFFWV